MMTHKWLLLALPLATTLSLTVSATEEPLIPPSATPAINQYLFGRQTLHWQMTPEMNKKVKVAFFDADSTLRVTRSGVLTPLSPEDVIILPGVAKKLKQLSDEGYLIAIVSNQGGIPRHTTLENADACLKETVRQIELGGAKVAYYDFAEKYDSNRKPELGMSTKLFEILKRQFGSDVTLDFENSMMVGDAAYKAGDTRPDGLDSIDPSNADRLFAENLGVQFFEASSFFGWMDFGIRRMNTTKDVATYEQMAANRLLGCVQSL